MKGAKSHSQTTNGWADISGNRATDPGDTQEEASSLTSVWLLPDYVDWSKS